MPSQAIRAYIPNLKDAAFLMFCKNGCGEGPQHSKDPPVLLSEASAQLPGRAPDGTTALDAALIARLSGGGTTEAQQAAKIAKDEAAAQKAISESVATIISSLLEGDKKKEVTDKAAAYALKLMD